MEVVNHSIYLLLFIDSPPTACLFAFVTVWNMAASAYKDLFLTIC